jgi:F1F0 ATPase subunit 2
MAVGAFFVGGLRLTLDRLSTARHPALLMLGSFVARLAVTVAALYLLSSQRVHNLVVAVAAFAVAHLYLTWRLGVSAGRSRADKPEQRDTATRGDG